MTRTANLQIALIQGVATPHFSLQLSQESFESEPCADHVPEGVTTQPSIHTEGMAAVTRSEHTELEPATSEVRANQPATGAAKAGKEKGQMRRATKTPRVQGAKPAAEGAEEFAVRRPEEGTVETVVEQKQPAPGVEVNRNRMLLNQDAFSHIIVHFFRFLLRLRAPEL